MIRNIKLKNILINTLFKGLSIINSFIPKNSKKILLYSNEGFRDNIKYLYKYLVENKYHTEYKIICSSNTDIQVIHDENIKAVTLIGGILHYFTSGHVYYCFGRIPMHPSKNQVTIQMWHGTSFKGFDRSTQLSNTLKNQFYTYVFASSEYFIPIIKKKFAVDDEHVYICGHPRNDWMFRDDIKYKLGSFSKNIIWLPTFRKSKKMGYIDVNTSRIIPFFEINELDELDQLLKSINVQVIVKLHPFQDLEYTKRKFTNIMLYSDSEFTMKGYDLYRLLGQVDALITDYSSVFYDYLLLDRPIGFTEDDEKEYLVNRGFAVDNPDYFKPGFRIQSKAELYDFIISVRNNVDKYKNKRQEINTLSNKYKTGNCIRALEISGIHLHGE